LSAGEYACAHEVRRSRRYPARSVRSIDETAAFSARPEDRAGKWGAAYLTRAAHAMGNLPSSPSMK
jgi:hypothetical protein